MNLQEKTADLSQLNEEMTRQLYAADMKNAMAAWQRNDVRLMERLLRRMSPAICAVGNGITCPIFFPVSPICLSRAPP